MAEYIEKEEVIKLLKDEWNRHTYADDAMDSSIDLIRAMSVADVAPVVHGKWIERNPKNSKTCRLVECNKCGDGYIVSADVPLEEWISSPFRRFCGRCGAKMGNVPDINVGDNAT